ncbi:SDR family oxidoreductase [Geodermatophilus sabuli]|uniref:NAD(P)-dependent dehydrogenase, short-chain alcohol dehydrogenase family n=1 Tax=Geodermatophilus sabuli TaxID=1564158 RepID=A0A285EAC4_9ACTN|nr:SDR family oxidoreductase [Geodermatophilus sabuli]MBB3085497.1 NAD(P)-dependent dehydrogenase (short-subunit alcohol dehydrogenase family) [Geodermatophilus sabuli]SNX96079.1 NAD(P)-dependent dehydrogenase, short-chain alcohol dehydrogenase family [Geodermatophilus sabuli]
MDLQLGGRVVVVTGASSGVGLATTRYLKAEGARVVASARDLDRLRRAVGDLPGPGQVHAAACDVVDRDSVEAMVAEGVAAFGGVDGVVCNAGRSLMAPIGDTTDEQIREELELKVFGAWNVIRAARKHLAASDAASVVNVNAILARQPETRLAVTSAARAALLNLTRTLSQDLGADGIRVNTVALGLIDTGQWRRRYESAGTAQSYEEWAAAIAADRGIALGRFGRAEEVAFPIVSFLSPLSSYCTGATIDVGGGVSRYI